jgi:hypothetical protein
LGFSRQLRSFAIRFVDDEKGDGMNPALMVEVEGREGTDVDPIEEIRLRTWARQNYAPASERGENWHPIILDEMTRKDEEVF